MDQWRDVARADPAPAPLGAGRRVPLGRKVEIVAATWFVLVVIADIVVTKPNLILIGLVNLSTLVVSSVASARRTAVFGVAALAASAGALLWDPTPSAAAVVRIINAVLVGLIAVGIAALRQRREDQLFHVTAAAEAAQRVILPTLPSVVGGVALACRYHSAAAEALLGGDVYDVYRGEDGRSRVIVLVADVCGKGLGSVQEGARLIRAFRQFAPTSQGLVRLAERMNAYMQPFLGSDLFITAMLADVSTPGVITLASCGHPPPFLLTREGLRELPIEYGPPIGLGSPTATTTCTWDVGDRLLIHTDGLTEARDRNGQFMPMAQIEQAIKQDSVDQALDALVRRLEQHVPQRRLQDDVCLVLLEELPSPTGEAVTTSIGPPTTQAVPPPPRP